MLLALAAAPADATFPGSTGDVVWSESGHILLGDPFDPESVERDLGEGIHPQFSPDGTQILFSKDSDGHGSFAIFVMNANGGGVRQVTDPTTTGFDCFHNLEGDVEASWSPDGSKIVFARQHLEGVVLEGDPPSCEDRHDAQLRVVSAASGGDGALIYEERGTGPVTSNGRIEGFDQPDWSPDGSRIAFHHSSLDIDGNRVSELIAVTPSGAALWKKPVDVPRIDWSPDGKVLAYAELNNPVVDLLDANGALLTTVTAADANALEQVAFTPDGARLVVNRLAEDGAHTQILKLAYPKLDFDPNEPDVHDLAGPNVDMNNGFDFQPADHPIVFIHGYAGSELACGSDVKWFGTLPKVGQLVLAPDGDSAAPGQCGASARQTLLSVPGKDIYGSALEKLRGIADGRVWDVAWDWRRDPRLQLDRLREKIAAALADDVSKKQALDEVVLVGHSFGGLFIRAALEDAEIRKQVRRVLTIGTPYWGAPKAIFPLCCGVETPSTDEILGLDLLIKNSDMKAFAKNNTGNYWLYPSKPYGPWLTWLGTKVGAGDAVGSVVKALGGSLTAFGRAVDGHAKLDGFPRLEPYGLREYRAVVGRGLPTIGEVKLTGDEAVVEWITGDGTVPARSGTQGPVGTKDPLGADIPISYVCGVEHVPLPGDPKVFEPFKDYIRYGRPPLKIPVEAGCAMSAISMSVHSVDIADEAIANSSKLTGTLAALRAAQAAGRLDLVETGTDPIAGIDARSPFDLSIPLDGASVDITPVTDAGDGRTIALPPLKGTLRLTGGPNAAPSVTLDGKAPPQGRLTVSVRAAKASLRSALAKGVRFTASSSGACRLTARLVLASGRVVGTVSARFRRKGTKKLKLRVRSGKALKRARGRATLAVSAGDPQGRYGAVTKKLTLR